MSKSVYRAGELEYRRSEAILGERPGTSLRSRFLRDMEDELTRVRKELTELREAYSREAKELAEAYARKKAAFEADLENLKRSGEAEAKKIRDSAAEEVEKAKKQGHDEGFEAGTRAGQDQAAQAVAAEMAVMQQRIQDAREAFLNRVQASEPKLFETALAISEKIIRQKIQVDPDVVREVVREAVGHIRENNPVRIRVHPSDVDRLEEFRKLSPEAFRSLPVTILADGTLSPGDCVAETGLEFIDATVARKLETLRDRLIPRAVI